jgi:2-polyprenyl-3-methyl-5-hydroxy-6-metoxy-1,4-benzoquinol methylase
MNDKPNRIHKLEYIDLGPDYYTELEYKDCLYQLGRIGKYLGGNRATFKAIQAMKEPIQSLLEVGCGGGSFSFECAKRFPDIKIVGIDLAREAIEYANQLTVATPLQNLQYKIQDSKKSLAECKSVDIVTATLVCHHMQDNEIIEFLKNAKRVARTAIIINDLHRNWIAYLLFAIVAPIFFCNRLIIHDGLLSIKRAFIKSDWKYYLTQAGINEEDQQITWYFPFRWVVTIKVKDE